MERTIRPTEKRTAASACGAPIGRFQANGHLAMAHTAWDGMPLGSLGAGYG